MRNSRTSGNGGVVLITGASGGLGLGLARAFLADGWKVAAMGGARLPAVEGADDGGVMLGTMDVTSGQQCGQVVRKIMDRWGAVDVLVNNAGTTTSDRVGSLTEEAWNRVLDVNLKGAFHCCRAVLPTMTERRRGHIVNIGSYAGRAGAVGQAHYAAAKAALIGLTMSLAREVAEACIRVNVVLPGLMPTPMTGGVNAEVLEKLVGQNLLGRMNGVDDVAASIVDLARTRDVSGQVLQWDSRVSRWC